MTLSKIPNVKKSGMPREIEAMKATLVDEPFSREGWIFETKYDGVRALCYIRKGEVELVSRNQKSMTIKYPELASLPQWVGAKEAILDGEIVVLNSEGNADFQELQTRFGMSNKSEIAKLGKRQKIVLYVFDLLYLDGYDLRAATLLDRKAILKKILHQRTALQFAKHVETNGIKAFEKAEKAHLEGIIAKNGLSKYEERRSNEWLKIKTVRRQEAVICGYTEPRGSRDYFGALHLGLYQGKKLVSVGKVGSGFDHDKLKSMYDLMKPLRIDHHPFDEDPKLSNRWRASEPVQWLKPKLVCEVRYTERTEDGSFRHPVFEGLREDKKPSQCHYEETHSTRNSVSSAEHKTRTKPTKQTKPKRTTQPKKLAKPKVASSGK